MKVLIVIFTTLIFSAQSFAQCITLEQAQKIASDEISKAIKNDPQGADQGEYDRWAEAVTQLEYTQWKGIEGYMSSWSVSNYEDVRMFVDCLGVFSVATSFTEN